MTFSFFSFLICEVYFPFEIVTSTSNHRFGFMGNGFISSSSDDEMMEQLLVDMDRQRQFVFACVVVIDNSFNYNELEEGASQSRDLHAEIQDVFVIMTTTLRFFKTFTDFALVEFNELVKLMVPMIVNHAQLISGHHNIVSN